MGAVLFTCGIVAAGAGVTGSPAKATSPVATPAAAPARINVADTYAAVTESGRTRHLRLVSRTSGKVLETLGSARYDGYNDFAFESVDLARDGSVYAVLKDKTLPPMYQHRLYRFTTQGATPLRPHVTSAQESPDGKRLATTVFSPDGDGDGHGLEALRIADKNGKAVKTLMASKFGVWKDGTPAVNAGGARVIGWLPNGDIAMQSSCCDSGWAWLASSTRPMASQRGGLVPSDRRTVFSGLSGTTIIGYRGNTALIAHPHDDYLSIAYTRWYTKTQPRGKVLRSMRMADNKWIIDYVDQLNKAANATPLQVSRTRFPYKGPGKVVSAHL